MFFSVAFGLLFGLFLSLVVGLVKPRWVCFPSRVALLKGMGVIFGLIVMLGFMVDGTKNSYPIANLVSFIVGFLILFVLDIKIDISDKEEDKEKDIQEALSNTTLKWNI